MYNETSCNPKNKEWIFVTIWVKLIDFMLSLIKPGPERQILDKYFIISLVGGL